MLNSTVLFDEDSESSVDIIANTPQNSINGTIPLSYVNRNYPFMYLNPHTGAITGIYADMWRELARWEKKELIFMKGTVYGKG